MSATRKLPRGRATHRPTLPAVSYTPGQGGPVRGRGQLVRGRGRGFHERGGHTFTPSMTIYTQALQSIVSVG